MVHVVWEPTLKPGRYGVYLGESFLCHSKTPFLSAARRLIEIGYDPSEKLTGGRTSTECALSSTIGEAAKLTVEETKHGPIFRKYVPWGGLDEKTDSD
jgi:hypothetical protein